MKISRDRTWHTILLAALDIPLAQYVVGEATQIVPAQPHGRTFKPGCPLRAVITNWDNYSSDETMLSPVAAKMCLLPTVTNEIGIRNVGHGAVELSFELQCDAASLAVQFPNDVPELELDLYVDPESARDESVQKNLSGAEILDAFFALQAGEFPRELAFAADDVYPKQGTRGIVPEGKDVSRGAHPVDLLAQLTHPFSERFARLPLRQLLTPSFIDGRRISFKIQLGDFWAVEVVRCLKGRLFLNHAIFWNRLMGQVDPLRAESDDEIEIRGSQTVMLEVSDTKSGATYFDHRFAPGTDPARLFRVCSETGRAEHENKSRLEFFDATIRQRNLRVRYLKSTDWSDFQVITGSTCFERNGPLAFVARSGLAPVVDEECRGSDSVAIARDRFCSALAMHPRSFPGELPMTRHELRDVLMELTPPQLKRHMCLTSGGNAAIRFETTIRSLPESSLYPRTMWRQAFAVTRCHLQLKSTAPLEELQYFGEWLTRKLQRQCPMGLFPEVVLNKESSI